MIKEVNPFAQKYIQAGDVLKENPTEDVRIVLKIAGHTIDPCRYNLPTETDVAVIIPTAGLQNVSSRDIVVYKNSAHHPVGKHLM